MKGVGQTGVHDYLGESFREEGSDTEGSVDLWFNGEGRKSEGDEVGYETVY